MSSRAKPPHDFDAIYASATPPGWDIGRPQGAFVRLAAAEGLVGRVLDVGCGTGEHALLAASLGHDALGVDRSPRAVERARAKAANRALNARFLVADALRLSDLAEQFDTVLDCGLFHVLSDDERSPYVAGLTSIVPQGGRFHLLCFSDRQPGDSGPRRVTQDELRSSFAEGWAIDSIAPAILELTWNPDGAHAWQLSATRTDR